jgi:undecaprenyl-diphosphatase
MNGHHCVALDAVLYPISYLGEHGLLLAMLVLGTLVGAPRGRWKEWAAVGVALLLADRLLFELVALYGFRERPFLALDGVRQVGPLWYTSSFPSGHAHYAWLVSVLLGARRPIWLAALIPFTLLTCYSRPYLGMHYPSDVIAGSAFGVVSGFAFLAVQRWWREHLAGTPAHVDAPPPPLGHPQSS